MKIPAFLVLLAAAAPIAAGAQDMEKVSGTPPERIQQLTVYGKDPCPRSTGEEVIVCARMPEGERYRVPKPLRDKRKADAPAAMAWGARSMELENVSRQGLPGSCNTGGSNGQTGCFQQFLAQARAERELAKRQAAEEP
ncbi:hypothetical protein [Sphingomonas prati]|uniref:Uncharacterized protein n=1 Tax=Sphingomonas prati TaxID=1843237 RepID=A0A7W9F1D0_9SPHN|nr:hypothetical protein [Sphingomonas prati]MBB5729121.1 hypothetical protein [Sphingomonas prati]GGE84916.1 hypothetical protein GCM10011404_17100 [Sphingomonas prati]